jgi:hypothetical protein
MSDIANSPDFPRVAVCFQDDSINMLFSALLEAHGVEAIIVGNIEAVPTDVRIITEPQYFPKLNQDLRKNCLLVANANTKENLQVPILTRPLTEEKVESAIKHLLR